MTAITNNSLPTSIDRIINYLLTDSDDDPVFNELSSDSIPHTEPQENQEIPPKDLKRKTTDWLNQPIAKKAYIEPGVSPSENNATISPEMKKELMNSINRTFHRTNISLEETQTQYANQLKVDLQEVKNIYSSVSTHCPTANESSVLNTKASLPANCSITVGPKLKKKLTDAINRNFDKIKPLHLEKIQVYYANWFKLNLQEIKNIYSAVPPPYSTIVTKTVPHKNLKDLDLGLKISSRDTTIIISPEAKKNLVDNINHLFHTTAVPLEKIQSSYANQFKIALQDVKDIYSAISTHCSSANKVSKIKQIGFFQRSGIN